jgi:hypothetical protein
MRSGQPCRNCWPSGQIDLIRAPEQITITNAAHKPGGYLLATPQPAVTVGP